MKSICKKILNFILLIVKIISFLNKTFLNIFFFFIFIFIIYLFSGVKTKEDNEVSNQENVLNVNLDGSLIESYDSNAFVNEKLPNYESYEDYHIQQNSLFLLCNKIKQAAKDKKITSILLNLKNFYGGSQPSLEYFGKCLEEFKKSGKPIYAVGKNFSQSQYYLASFSDLIFLQKHGDINFYGFTNKTFYYKSALDKLYIHSHVFRQGKYKSAVEPILKNKSSKEVKKENLKILKFLWNEYIKQISINRKIPMSRIFPLINKRISDLEQLNGDTGNYAKKNKLVDYLLSKNDIKKILNEKFLKSTKNKKYELLSIYEYKQKTVEPKKSSVIAIITNNGSIINDKKNKYSINPIDTINKIRFAKKNKYIKSLIFFINSPGGTLEDSEKIQKELNNFKKSKKPLIILMGGTAASGGYWISTSGDYIISSPTTITGSIGIFNVFYTLEKTLDMMGIHYDGVSTSSLDKNNLFNGFTPELDKFIQFNINKNYNRFVKLVSKSRKKTIKEIKKIAQGKIWTGYQAKKLGLVDQLGNLNDAIKKSANLAHLKKFNIQYIYTNKQITFSELLFFKINYFLQKICINMIENNFPINITKNINLLQSNKDLLYIIKNPEKKYLYMFNNKNFIH
ncbi:Protease 4 [Buchnera aphidicola (Periphyllus testudinaceus)]|uniref:signal peptide peptidase SppA n=1 Tax=Buchnera aphidicola TaxID=9 RepID=UPI003464E438